MALYFAGKTQIQFGPYLTYSGTAANSGQMTIQLGVSPDDTQTYYVVYWNSTLYNYNTVSLGTSKIINTKSCEFYWLPGQKYKILSTTLTNLTPGTVYTYMVSQNGESFTNYAYTSKTSITPADITATGGKPLVLLNSATLSGTFSGVSGEIKLITGISDASLSNFTLPIGNTFAVSIMPVRKKYTFRVPNNADTTLSCFLISDTQIQSSTDSLNYYKHYTNITNALKNNASFSNYTFMLHGGDFADYVGLSIKQIQKFPDLFGSIPVQMTEGNHDRGYNLYSTKSPVTSDSQINIPDTAYTKEMIWFDKLFHYDYPGLKTTVKTKAGTITDYYSHNYSFDYGPAHISVLDYDNYDNYYSQKDTGFVTKQLRWLIDDLDATTKQWKVIMMHYDQNSGNNGNYYSINAFNYKSVQYTTTSHSPKVILYSIISEKSVALVIDGHQHFPDRNAEIITSLENFGLRNFFHMRVPVDAANTLPLSMQYSYYILHFIGKEFYFDQFDKNNVLSSTSSHYILDQSKTIILKP